ncbi:hypothetical protein JAAARDRAFT_35147 [Jaapia argillacea MUCL 33604]|uniref:AMP-dependent synthetase/ligase domain-containing protein n=1 Tax=Jaapia argillacea MUCL 33604 TaxID=933084 RepID=A0A067Q4D8_9AGAM|nr:hypothetical protein JAAARDRAFT_35147 [Jaapia argillacea MUCL 33604]
MTENHFAHSRLIWRPANPNATRVDALRRTINWKHGLHLKDFHDLHKYSVEDYTFWKDLWEYLGIIYSVPPQKIVVEGRMKEVPTWFPGARLNYAENLLYRNDDAVAVTCSRETGIIAHYTFRQLRDMVKDVAAALKVNGLEVGDRVAAIATNSIHAVVVCLAAISAGGVYSSTATDMGTQGILDRYRQIQPKFVFAETEVCYAGKTIDLLPKVAEVARDLASKGLKHVILLPSTKMEKEVDLAIDVPRGIMLSKFLASGDGRELTFEQLPFNHPVYILYSSGTSGAPKCMIHAAGGVLMQHKKELALVYDLNVGDTYFQHTTTGWMMWPFMLSGLSCGVRIITYDGSPFYPDVKTFLKFVSDQCVTVFGTSPRFLTEVQGNGIKPSELAPFESLRIVMSTGAILTTPMFEWTQHAFRPDVYLVSGSGGTDICADFVTGVATLPVYAGEIQGKSLGMKMEVFDPTGQNIEHTGQPGELVCTRPHPSLPVGFWGDVDGAKFRSSYYEMYPGIWRQGDFVVVNPKTKGFMILGRSDGVLNPSGVRFGSGEIYSVMEKFSSILDDSLCVGQRRPHDKDERVLLFLKMRPGQKFTSDLCQEIRGAIRSALSARHVPSYIFEISDIPYTVNGKKIEIAVKQIVSGVDVKPSGTVANPESLQLYYKYRNVEAMAASELGTALKAKL